MPFVRMLDARKKSRLPSFAVDGYIHSTGRRNRNLQIFLYAILHDKSRECFLVYDQPVTAGWQAFDGEHRLM
jgi:hypothetical protein